MPPLSTSAQAQVQACGSAIFNMKRAGGIIQPDFLSSMQFANFREPDEQYNCLGCGTMDNKMSACGACHAVSYCTSICQKKDWKERHRYECQAMKQAYDAMKLAGKFD